MLFREDLYHGKLSWELPRAKSIISSQLERMAEDAKSFPQDQKVSQSKYKFFHKTESDFVRGAS
jgi:hypothetical protein